MHVLLSKDSKQYRIRYCRAYSTCYRTRTSGYRIRYNLQYRIRYSLTVPYQVQYCTVSGTVPGTVVPDGHVTCFSPSFISLVRVHDMIKVLKWFQSGGNSKCALPQQKFRNQFLPQKWFQSGSKWPVPFQLRKGSIVVIIYSSSFL